MDAQWAACTHEAILSARAELEKDKLGFRGSYDLKVGCDWMVGV